LLITLKQLNTRLLNTVIYSGVAATRLIANVSGEKKFKYWQRNGGFTFWPEEKIIL